MQGWACTSWGLEPGSGNGWIRKKTIVTTYGNGRKETKEESDGIASKDTNSYSVKVLTNQGKKSIDAGEKIKTEEEDKNGVTIKSSSKVNVRTASFKYYPFIIVKSINNGWEIIKEDRSKIKIE